MTGNFKEFKVESQTTNDAWDEHNVVASTAVRFLSANFLFRACPQ